MLFSKWNWINPEELLKLFEFEDWIKYPDGIILKGIRYGCERVDLESGGTILEILADKPFPGDLTKKQEEAVKESAAWCANHMIRQGLDWLRGSTSISLGSISTGQTNPDEPDYFPPFLKQKLVQAGLINFIHSANIRTEKEYEDFNKWGSEIDTINKIPSLDLLKRTYLAKRGQNSLTSKDGSMVIKPNGGLYDGVDLSVVEKDPVSDNLHKLDKNLIADKDTYNVRFREEPKSYSISHRLDLVYREYWIKELDDLESRIPGNPALDKIRKKVKELGDEILKLSENHFQDVGKLHRELAKLDKKVDNTGPLPETLKKIDHIVEVKAVLISSIHITIKGEFNFYCWFKR